MGLSPRRATRAPPLPPRGDLGGTRKVLLASFCNRRSIRASVSSSDCRAKRLALLRPRQPRRSLLERRDPRCARPPCDDPTPTHPRLTAWGELRPFPCTLTVRALPFSRRTSRRSSAGARNDAPFSDAASLHERPLTPPVTHALRTTVGAAIRFAYAEDRLHRRLVKGDCLRRPETPSTGRCSLDLQHPVRDTEDPSLVLDGNLSPCASLGREVPASGARSPTLALAKDG